MSEHCLVAMRKAVKELREFCPLINKMACEDWVFKFLFCGNLKAEGEGCWQGTVCVKAIGTSNDNLG